MYQSDNWLFFNFNTVSGVLVSCIIEDVRKQVTLWPISENWILRLGKILTSDSLNLCLLRETRKHFGCLFNMKNVRTAMKYQNK